MKIALNLKALEAQPRKFVSLLREDDQGPTEFTGEARRKELSLLQQFIRECLIEPHCCLIYRRWVYKTKQESQFILRPHPNELSDQFAMSRLALVCQLDKDQCLEVVGAEARSGEANEEVEQNYTGGLCVQRESLWDAPETTDEEGAAFIKQLPEVGADIATAIKSWTHYLDWRQKLAERKANELYTFKTSQVIGGGNKVEVTLEDSQVCEMIKNRLSGETVRLYTEDAREQLLPDEDEGVDDEDEFGERTRRIPPKALFEGAFKWVHPIGNDNEATRGRGGYNLRRHGSPKGQPEQVRIRVESENDDDDDRLRASDLPERGILQAAMEGELSAIDVQRNGLRRLAEFQSQNPQLRHWLFHAEQAFPCQADLPEFNADSEELNDEQRHTVRSALALQDLLLLWGPPGTGKTATIAEIASQYCRLDCRVLIASQANLAVDQALVRLPELPHIRPARISSSKQKKKHGIDVRENMRWWLRACANQIEVDAKSEEDPKWKGLMDESKRHFRNHVRLQDLDEPTIRHYLKKANVVGATCSETGKPDFYNSSKVNPKFDLSIVDEVSKATPPELILPALLGKRTMLVGDHRQLPPVFRETTFPEAVENKEITAKEFDDFKEMVTGSYFQHLFESVDPSICVALQQQYRMHPQIMEAVNQFYADQPLRSGGGDAALAHRKTHNFNLSGRSGGQWLKPGVSLAWIDSTYDVRGQAVENQRAGTSRFNDAEADLCVDLLQSLLPKTESIGVISLYRAQVLSIQSKLRSESHPKLRKFLAENGVNTVDQFQGSERDIIIVSLTRTDDHLTGEFVKDFRRINVAISRARKLLIVVGRRETFDSGLVEVPTTEVGKTEEKPAYQAIREIADQHGVFTTLQAVSSERGAREKPSHQNGQHRPQKKKHHKPHKNDKTQKSEKMSKRELDTLFDDFDQKFSKT